MLIPQPHSNQCSSGESMKTFSYKYSIARITANSERELRTDKVGLKADWDTISWTPIHTQAECLGKVALGVANIDDCESRAESYEDIKCDSVRYGYDVVVISAKPIHKETLERMEEACVVFAETIFTDADISSQRLNLRPSLNERDAKIIEKSVTEFLSVAGRRTISVPHTVCIGDECIPSPPRYANKPKSEEMASENPEIAARFIGAELIEKLDTQTAKKSVKGTCKVIQYPSHEPLLLIFNPDRLLSQVHARLFDRVYYCLQVRKDYGLDGKSTFTLCEIGEPSLNAPQLTLT